VESGNSKKCQMGKEPKYSAHHAEDETSYNARRSIEGLSELSECVNALAEHLPKIVTLTQEKVEATAQTSLRWSVIGLVFILIEFCGQLIGSFPCG
jgi:hypothetical protein